MVSINNFNRKIINHVSQLRLKNKDFTLIASNGAFICHDLNIKFNSPFVNLWFKPKDFIKYVKNIEHYMSEDLIFIQEDGIFYPIGLLEDIKIYFKHYKSEEEAKEKWIERTKRINLDNIFILMTDRDGCTYNDLEEFDKLAYKNKVVFTNKPYPDIKSAFYIKGFENMGSVGMCFEYMDKYSGKKYYDQFDYVKWFNNK